MTAKRFLFLFLFFLACSACTFRCNFRSRINNGNPPGEEGGTEG